MTEATSEQLSLAQETVSGGYETDTKLLEQELKPSRRARSWGSAPGQWYERETKAGPERWYVKFRRQERGTLGSDQLRAEFIAQRIYHRLGFNVPESHLITIDGHLAIAKKDVLGLTERPNPSQLAAIDEVRHGMLVDVYLNNWDITNNFGIAQGKVYRLDQGGALDCQAKGKPKDFGPLRKVDIENFRNPEVNYQGSVLYETTSEEDLEHAAKLIAGLTNEEIAAIVKAAGYEDKRKEIKITTTLIRRRERIKRLFRVEIGEKPEVETDEQKVWEKLEALVPEDKRLKKVMLEIERLDSEILIPWIKSAEVVEQTINSLKETGIEVALEDRYVTLAEQISAIYKSIEGIEKLIQTGRNPTIAIGGKGGVGESIKWKASRAHRERRIAEGKAWCQKKKLEAEKLFLRRVNDMSSSVEGALEKIEQEDEYKKALTSTERMLVSNAPSIIQRVSDSIFSAQEHLDKLKQFSILAGHERLDKQDEIRGLEERVKSERARLESFWKDQIITIGRTVVVLADRLRNVVSMHPKYGVLSNAGCLAPLLVIPTKEQEKRVEKFCQKASKFIEQHKEVFATIFLREDRISKAATYIQFRRKNLKRKCEQIRTDRICHMTLTHDEYAKQVLRDGFLMSSLGQQKARGRASVNSPAGQKELLPELTFSINGAELQYGGKREGRVKKEEYLGVGFVFPFTLAVEGKQFYEQTSSQGLGYLGYEHYNELHVFHPEYDGSYKKDDWEHAEVKLDIDEGIFIAPEAEKEEWTKFLLTPKAEGGAGKDKRWMEEHVRFYPEYTKPNDFVEFSDAYGGLPIPKSELGILVPTGRSGTIGGSNAPTPLFRWVSATSL